MVRLIGEVAALRGDHTAKKRFLMDGLCKLIHADAWIWALSCQRDPDKPQVYVSFLRSGFEEATFVKFLEAIDHPEMVAFASKFFVELQNEKTHLTRSRFQITTPEQFLPSGAHEAWKAANIGPTILSMRPLDEQSSSTLGFYRYYNRPEFSARETRIAHIVLTEVPWLHEQGWPEDRGATAPKLSKRQRIALNLLTLGQSRKEIAENMGISIYTAQDYIKQVYRHFNVRSHAELMGRFINGDGRDVE
jgi:DNA-binding CsgD family transcriptional regulator